MCNCWILRLSNSHSSRLKLIILAIHVRLAGLWKHKNKIFSFSSGCTNIIDNDWENGNGDEQYIATSKCEKNNHFSFWAKKTFYWLRTTTNRKTIWNDLFSLHILTLFHRTHNHFFKGWLANILSLHNSHSITNPMPFPDGEDNEWPNGKSH